MSTYDLEEQEQIATLKSWWKEHGNLVLGAVTVALAVFAAWNGWKWHVRTQAVQAAALYETLQKAARVGDAKSARDAAGTILEKYSSTTYAPLAALISAKVSYQTGDPKTAKAQLQWVVQNAKSEELRAVARLRLASVLLDENAYDDALKTLESKPSSAFDALTLSLKGDILVAQKKTAEARSAYRSALEKIDPKDLSMRESLRLKLDTLGESQG